MPRDERKQSGNSLKNQLKSELKKILTVFLKQLKVYHTTLQINAVWVYVQLATTAQVKGLGFAYRSPTVSTDPVTVLKQQIFDSLRTISPITAQTVIQHIERLGFQSNPVACHHFSLLRSKAAFKKDSIRCHLLHASALAHHQIACQILDRTWQKSPEKHRTQTKLPPQEASPFQFMPLKKPRTAQKMIELPGTKQSKALVTKQLTPKTRTFHRIFAQPIRRSPIPLHRLNDSIRGIFNQALCEKANVKSNAIQLKLVYPPLPIHRFESIRQQSFYLLCSPQKTGRSQEQSTRGASKNRKKFEDVLYYIVVGIRLDTRADIMAQVPYTAVAENSSLGN
ncbi:MAG: hypothetical protein AAGI66_08280 [Cyanobacteria bacterium P01_H01_bin.74]